MFAERFRSAVRFNNLLVALIFAGPLYLFIVFALETASPGGFSLGAHDAMLVPGRVDGAALVVSWFWVSGAVCAIAGLAFVFLRGRNHVFELERASAFHSGLPGKRGPLFEQDEVYVRPVKRMRFFEGEDNQ